MPRILVADDNSNIQKMVVLALEERGVDVVAVGNGEAAVRRLPDVNPDLVLADVFMPVRNGYEVCEFIKKDTRYAHIPVILLVGAFDPLDEKEARRVGADGVLKKPFVPPDPLIAMVMSVLEKNPRIAAELAKQKEIIAVPPPQPEAIEVPLHSEPKPLPEFPEPTPEEAAAIYGFGKGVRALAGDDSDEEDEGQEEKRSRKSKTSKSSNAPAAKAEESQEDNDFDNIATVSDWRRNAADFDVPENTAQDSQDSFGSDLDTSAFPSEKDVPPRHIRTPVESDEQAISANDASPVAEPSEEFAEPQSNAADEPLETAFAETSVVEDAPQTSHAMWLPEPASEQVEAPAPAALEETHEDPEPVSASEPIPSIAARHTEWMDMMAPPPSEYPNGGWMSNLSAPAAQLTSLQAEHEAKQVGKQSESSPNNNGGSFGTTEHAEETSERETDRGHDSQFPSHFDSEDRFSGHVAEASRPSYHFPSESRERENEATAPSANNVLDFGTHVVVAPADSEKRNENGSSLSAPEPVLAREEPTAPSDYSAHHGEPSPVQHILPAPTEDLGAQSVSATEGLDTSVFERAPQEHVTEEFSERIPTLPPPNREALSGIAFLMPPAVQVDATTNQPSAEAVDALVQKVLEKLRPQLQDLFSQGVKPLVENLVYSELTKKDR
ncbi:MAG TPA: response regulator [Candidatus Acidoferrales bacterium]|nr:response regulator [Candidatus Acidoferrales bacterium]